MDRIKTSLQGCSSFMDRKVYIETDTMSYTGILKKTETNSFTLKKAKWKCLGKKSPSFLFDEIEPDFRAMHSPYRQKTILAAADDLIKRLSSMCPQCERVDFVPIPSQQALPCELCGQPTNKAKPPIKRKLLIAY